MSDAADDSDYRIARTVEEARLAAAKKVEEMDQGERGECDRCGEDSPRLVGYGNEWICCKCRDKYGLP